MPMSRYEIRNEYSLADPELYRAADKDDPEALLEGVAMAGLVGVLRQLGDLAEFAAEIFHDLHEEVMATAARGHGLMIRVQQLESEVPSLEKAFLSQTDHSSFFYNAGVDWHPNVQMDHNLVTQGDLPRFIMDSYEECRGPPRLFLLDKFDVAGAGACLKRYTDPAFFKVETSEMTAAELQREKKIRKAKKKGPRWRNGETPEVLPTSHAKLHQLFLEERVENGVSNPARRVKLKKRLNGFPFNAKAGKSFMEKLLRSPSPEHKVLHEVTVSSPLLMLPMDEQNEAGLEVLDIRPVSPDRESVRKRISPPDEEEIMLNPSMYEPVEVLKYDKICELPNSYPSRGTDEISSNLDNVTNEKDIAINKESKAEGILTGYQSDDVASEIDNYVDAPSTMGSEMDTDSERRMKNDFSSLKRIQPSDDANGENIHSRSSDSQSTGEPPVSDEGNNSSQKEISSTSSSGSQSTSTENPHSDKCLVAGSPSADIFETDLVDDASSYQNTDENLQVEQFSNTMVYDHAWTDIDAITKHGSDFEQLPSGLLGSTHSDPTLAQFSLDEVVAEDRIRGPELKDADSSLKDDERNQHSPSILDSALESGDGSLRFSTDKHAADEQNGECIHSPNDLCHTDGSITAFGDLLLAEDSYSKELNFVENIASSSDMPNVVSQNNNASSDIIPGENAMRGKLDDEATGLPENLSYDCPDIVHDGNNSTSTVSREEELTNKLDTEDSPISPDDSNNFSYSMQASHDEELAEICSADANGVETEDHHLNRIIDKHISSENLILPHKENSPHWSADTFDAYERDEIPEDEILMSSQSPGVTGDVFLKDSAARGSSLPNLEEPAGLLDNVEKDGTTPCTNPVGVQVAESLGSPDITLPSEVPVLLDEYDCETDQPETGDMASASYAGFDNSTRNNACVPVGLGERVEKPSTCSKNSLGEIENDNDCLSGSHTESCLVEEVGQREVTSDLDSVFWNSVENNHIKSKESDNVPNVRSDIDVEESLNSIGATPSESSLEQSCLDAEQETVQQINHGTHVSDASSLPIDADAEEKLLQENIDSLPNQLNEELLNTGEISLGNPPVLPFNTQQIPDLDYQNGHDESSSTFSPITCSSLPSFTELPVVSNSDNNVSGYPKYPLDSLFPPSNQFPETNQINLDELPPLPPLPPVQWRMGKFHHPLSVTEGEMGDQQLFPRVVPAPVVSTDAVSSPLEEMNHSLAQFSNETALEEEKVEHSPFSLDHNAMHETIGTNMQNDLQLPAVSANAITSLREMNLPPVQLNLETTPRDEKFELSSSNLDADIMNEIDDLPAKVETESRQLAVCNNDRSSLLEEVNHSVNYINPDTTSEEEKVQQSSSSLEANAIHESSDIPSKIENVQQKLVMPFSGKESTLAAEEDGVSDGKRVKLPRPRNPLVDDVAALDKSKLRKVTERARPLIQKVDERDSLLEQIRTKSFNLKPAMASRPSIRGPGTNLKVAAILEKANAIRQALAGSDEDDEDNWSDS